MKVLLPPPANSSAAPRELDSDTAELRDILAFIEEAQAQGRLAHLAAIRASCHERLAELGNYEDLSEGEWTVFDAVNQALATLVRAVIPRIVADEVPRTPLDQALPFLASLDKPGLEALLEPASADEEIRLFREFYSAKFDYESDDSDEEDDDTSTSRGAKTRSARQKRAKSRKKTRRVYHEVDPSGALIRARMDKIADGYGRAYGEKSTPSKLKAALDKQETFEGASAEVTRADEAYATWVNEQVAALDAEPRRELENLGIGKRDARALKRLDALLKGNSVALKKKKDLEKSQKEAGTALRSWTALTSAAIGDIKGMIDWKAHMDANTVIHHPVGTWTVELLEELAAVNDALANGKEVPENRFVVAQYRGIAYNIDAFDAVARRRSRESVELKLPVYCSSVFSAAGVSPADYYAGAYASNADVNRRLKTGADQLKAVLLEKRSSGPIELDAAIRGVLRGEKVPEDGVEKGRYQHKLRWSAQPLTYSNAAYALQNFYTINYGGFFKEVQATMDRSSASKSKGATSTVEPSASAEVEVEAGPLDEILGGLLNAKNPLVSAGYIPRHALRYAYARKYYSGAEMRLKLFPEWQPDDGRAIHPYAGKVFVSLHPAEDYAKATGPLDVVVLHKAKEIDVPPDILAEREAAFPAFIPAERVVAEHIARYPSFSTEYDDVYLDKYGLAKEDYASYQALSGFATSRVTKETFIDALSEWLVRYHEARLIELARRLAERDNKVLVYRDLDGLLVPGEDVVDITPVTGVRSASSDDNTRTTLGASLEGRSSEDREELGPVAVVAQAALPLVGIYNYGNECYLNSALQVLRVFDPENRYERAGGARVGVTLAQATDRFLAKLTNDAANGTYVTRGLATYTNQNTVAIRRQLRLDGRIRTLYTQEDACDAMLAVLRAYDHGGLGFDDSPAWLRDHQGEFAARRPSQLHMLVRITTTYELGAAGVVAGGELALNADRQFTSYDVVNILRLSLPAPGDAPVPYADLLEANRDRALVGEDRTTARCLHDHAAYPNARRDRERTERIGDLPADFFVQLKRFSGGLAAVEQPKKPTSTDTKPPTTDQPPTAVKSTPTEPSPVKTTTEPSPTATKDDKGTKGATTTGGTQSSGGGFQAAKIKTLVDMPLALDSGHELRGIILHIGDTIAGGHYIAYVRHGQQWYEVNDAFVTAAADVTEPRQNGYVFYYRNG